MPGGVVKRGARKRTKSLTGLYATVRTHARRRARAFARFAVPLETWKSATLTAMKRTPPAKTSFGRADLVTCDAATSSDAPVSDA